MPTPTPEPPSSLPLRLPAFAMKKASAVKSCPVRFAKPLNETPWTLPASGPLIVQPFSTSVALPLVEPPFR